MTKVRKLPQPHNRSTRVWTIVWILLALFLVWRTGIRDRGVITDHIEFGRRVLFGWDLYAPFDELGKPLHAPYPPSFGLLTAPFALLPERLARFAWALLQIASLFVIARCLRDWVREFVPRALPRLHACYAFAALLGGRYVLRDTHGGGGNLINLALVLLAIERARHRREVSAGLLLGFSLATKPVAVLVLPLMWILGYRRAPGIAIAAALCFLMLALLLLGQGLAPFLTWFDGTVKYAGMTDLFAEPAGGFPPFTWMNQCLRCAVVRYLGEVPPEFAAQVPGFANGLGLGQVATSWLARALGLGLLLTVFAVLWRRRSIAAVRPWAVATALALTLLLSPISWKAHHVALLPGFFLLAALAYTGRRWPWFVAGGYFLLCGLGEQLVGKDLKEVQQAYYFTTLGTLTMLGIGTWQMYRVATAPRLAGGAISASGADRESSGGRRR